MTTPKTVVFDLGKVLVDFDYAIAARRIAARGTMTLLEIARHINQSPVFVQYETGKVTTPQFYEEIRRATGYRGDLAEFSESFADIFSPIEPMIDFQTALQQRGVPTYAFSNTNELAIDHITRSFPFYTTFTGHILSFQHGVMKPEAGLYEVVERETGCRGADILYIDDRPENVDAGAARGWQVILQETPERTLATVRTLGLVG